MGNYFRCLGTANKYVRLTDSMLQVTADAVVLIGGGPEWAAVAQWAPPEGKIQHAAATNNEVIVATNNGNLFCLNVQQGAFNVGATVQMPHELTAIAATAGYCVLSTWEDITVRVLSLPSLEILLEEKLPGDVIVRSLQLCSLDNGESTHLFAALGDGQPESAS